MKHSLEKHSHPPGSACPGHLIASVVIDDHDLRLVLSHSHHYKYENIAVYVGEGEKWKSQDAHAEVGLGDIFLCISAIQVLYVCTNIRNTEANV